MWQLLLFVIAALLTGPGPVRAEVIRGIDFPRQLGGFELGSVIDNEKTNAGLGVTLLYNAPGVKVSVFIYNHSRRALPEGIDASVVRSEFAEARNNVHQVYSHVQPLVREERFNVIGVPLLHAAFQYTEVNPGGRETMLSHLYLTSRKGNFVKVRATYNAKDSPEVGHRSQVRFVEELCRIIAR